MTYLLRALAVLVLACAGCGRPSSAFKLDVQTLRQLSAETTAGISYEVDGATVLVTVIDKYGDGHIHELVLGNLTHSQALDLLAEKQAELERGR